jgi:hypothetical protein
MRPLATTEPLQNQNGDLAVITANKNCYLQDKSPPDRRSVTPEVAGSSPVAPVSSFLADADDLAVPWWDRLFIADPGNGPGQRSQSPGRLKPASCVRVRVVS